MAYVGTTQTEKKKILVTKHHPSVNNGGEQVKGNPSDAQLQPRYALPLCVLSVVVGKKNSFQFELYCLTTHFVSNNSLF